MLKDVFSYLATLLSGVILAILGKWLLSKEETKNKSLALNIKEIDDRAQITKELWAEVRNNRILIRQLQDDLIAEKNKNLIFESKILELRRELEDFREEIERLKSEKENKILSSNLESNKGADN